MARVRPGTATTLGRNDHELFPTVLGTTYLDHDRIVIERRRALQFAETSLDADGTVRHWSSVKFPWQDDRGRRGVGGISIEITDRKRAAEQVTRSESLLRRLIEVQEHEKQSLCHEFHDGLMQYAIGARMVLEAWRHDHPEADATPVSMSPFRSPPRTGFGVVGMAERARLCGGSCRVESVSGRGTVVTARLATPPTASPMIPAQTAAGTPPSG